MVHQESDLCRIPLGVASWDVQLETPVVKIHLETAATRLSEAVD
jgi:hypothetical protein